MHANRETISSRCEEHTCSDVFLMLAQMICAPEFGLHRAINNYNHQSVSGSNHVNHCADVRQMS